MTKVHYAGKLTVCSACAEPIIFLAHERTGTLAPITVASYPNGNVYEIENHRYVAFGPKEADFWRNAGRALRLNHFGNCANADRFKRRNGR